MATLAASTVAGLGGSPQTSQAVTYEPAPPFCEGAVVHDYLMPLKRMPRLHSPPSTGRLGFASERLRLRPLPSLLVGEGKVGYELTLFERGSPVHLGWDVTATLVQVDWRGRVKEVVTRSRRHLATVSRRRGGGVRFPVGEAPAVYRLTVVFRTEAGRKLGGYGFYFRVVSPTQNARLSLNTDSYRPGNMVFGRIENFGTASVLYGAPYAIERQEGSAWTEAPESPRGPWILIGYITGPGLAAEHCSGFWVPPGMPLGRYRMVKELSFMTRLPIEGRPPSTPVAAEFDIVP